MPATRHTADIQPSVPYRGCQYRLVTITFSSGGTGFSRRWRQASPGEQPAAEAGIVVAVGRTRGAILRAGFRDQGADLASRRGEGTLMMLRLVARHGHDEGFEIVGHAVFLGMRRAWR